MAEVEQKQGKPSRREEELVEAALAAVAAALLVSGVKKLAPAVLVAPCWSWLWWPLPAAAPSPVLFLLLNVVIASIVVASVQPVRRAATATTKGAGVVAGAAAPAAADEGARKLKKRRSKKRGEESTAAPASVVADGRCMALVVKNDAAATDEPEAASVGDAGEEVDRRAEEFISAFRHRLRVDSFSSRRRDSEAGEAGAALACIAPRC